MKTAFLGPWAAAKEAEMFFEKRDKVHRALRRLVERMQKVGLDYCIVGGLALTSYVRRDFVECLDEFRREEEYEKRQDQLP
jgi:hypothetical protein